MDVSDIGHVIRQMIEDEMIENDEIEFDEALDRVCFSLDINPKHYREYHERHS